MKVTLVSLLLVSFSFQIFAFDCHLGEIKYFEGMYNAPAGYKIAGGQKTLRHMVNPQFAEMISKDFYSDDTWVEFPAMQAFRGNDGAICNPFICVDGFLPGRYEPEPSYILGTYQMYIGGNREHTTRLSSASPVNLAVRNHTALMAFLDPQLSNTVMISLPAFTIGKNIVNSNVRTKPDTYLTIQGLVPGDHVICSKGEVFFSLFNQPLKNTVEIKAYGVASSVLYNGQAYEVKMLVCQ